MSETKFAASTYSELNTANPYYNIYTSNCNLQTAKKQEASLGTAIAITKDL
jgi:hypothetical protein